MSEEEIYEKFGKNLLKESDRGLVFQTARRTGKSMFDPIRIEKALKQLHEKEVSIIFEQLQMPQNPTARALVEEGMKRFKDQRPSAMIFNDSIRQIHVLQDALCRSLICEYVCVEMARRIDPTWIFDIQERYKQEHDKIKAEMVTVRLKGEEPKVRLKGEEPRVYQELSLNDLLVRQPLYSDMEMAQAMALHAAGIPKPKPIDGAGKK